MKKVQMDEKKDYSFLFTFIIIFFSNDTLLFGTNGNRQFFWLHIGILFLTFLFMAIRVRYISVNLMWFTFLMSLSMLITLFVNNDNEIIKYAYNIFILVMSAVFCKSVSKKKFCNAFTTIMYYIALCSIILFCLWLVANPIVHYFPSITNESGIKYYFFGLGFLENLPLGVLPRMYGVFREPGVFTCFLILSLIIQLLFSEEHSIWRAGVITVASLLTFSTAAYILLIFVYISYLLNIIINNNNQNKSLKLLLTICITVVIVLFSIGPDKVFGIVFNKLNVENSSRDSRLGSVSANFLMFLENPALGKGWNYVEDNFINFASIGTYKGTHNTNTFFKLLALYGIFPFLCITKSLLHFFIKEAKSLIMGILILIIWIIALSNEDMTVNILLYLLPLYSFHKKEGT